MKIFAKFCLFLGTLTVSSAICAQTAPFKINGQPVNPGCVGVFNRFSVTIDYVNEINLNQCQLQQNRRLPAPKWEADGWLRVDFPKALGGGYYKYRVIGRTTNGIYVLDTINNTGGSEQFEGVLLLRVGSTKNQNWDLQKQEFTPVWHTTLDLVSRIPGGDRADGSYHSLKVFGNHIHGMKYSDENNPSKAPQFPDRKIDVDVSGL